MPWLRIANKQQQRYLSVPVCPQCTGSWCHWLSVSMCHIPAEPAPGWLSPSTSTAAPSYPALHDQEQMWGIHKGGGVSRIPTPEGRAGVRGMEREMAPSLSSNSAQWDCHYLRSGAIKLLTTFGFPWLWAPAPLCAFGSHPRICWLVITHQGPHSLS